MIMFCLVFCAQVGCITYMKRESRLLQNANFAYFLYGCKTTVEFVDEPASKNILYLIFLKFVVKLVKLQRVDIQFNSV